MKHTYADRGQATRLPQGAGSVVTPRITSPLRPGCNPRAVRTVVFANKITEKSSSQAPLATGLSFGTAIAQVRPRRRLGTGAVRRPPAGIHGLRSICSNGSRGRPMTAPGDHDVSRCRARARGSRMRSAWPAPRPCTATCSQAALMATGARSPPSTSSSTCLHSSRCGTAPAAHARRRLPDAPMCRRTAGRPSKPRGGLCPR